MESEFIQKISRHLDMEQMLRSLVTVWRPIVRRASLATMLQRKAVGIENVKRSEKQIFTTGRAFQLLLGLPSARRKVACDMVAEVLILQLVPSFERSQMLRETAETKSLLTQTMAALAVYRAEKGRWPAALSDLVPGILPAGPADPWSKDDASLIYKTTPEGFILYSIGYNEIDDGGKDGPGSDEGDIVVSDPKQEDE